MTRNEWNRRRIKRQMQRQSMATIIMAVGAVMAGSGIFTFLAGWNLATCAVWIFGFGTMYMGACVGDL